MKNKEQKKVTGNNISPKWIFAIIVVLALGFGTYGYFQVKKWMRYAAIEQNEKPITDYTVKKVYSDDHQPKRHRGYNDDDEKEKKPDYYMEVLYKGKEYKLEIEDYTYSKINSSGDVTLYYDAKADELFVAGTGGGNLLVTILVAAVAVIIVVCFLIWQLVKVLKRKKRQ